MIDKATARDPAARYASVEDLADDVALFTEDVLLLPAWETLPFEHISPNVPTMAARARARHPLSTADSAAVVAASVAAGRPAGRL